MTSQWTPVLDWLSSSLGRINVRVVNFFKLNERPAYLCAKDFAENRSIKIQRRESRTWGTISVKKH